MMLSTDQNKLIYSYDSCKSSLSVKLQVLLNRTCLLGKLYCTVTLSTRILNISFAKYVYD